MGKCWRERDLPMLEWRERELYATKSTFITLCIEDGAKPLCGNGMKTSEGIVHRSQIAAWSRPDWLGVRRRIGEFARHCVMKG